MPTVATLVCGSSMPVMRSSMTLAEDRDPFKMFRGGIGEARNRLGVDHASSSCAGRGYGYELQ